MIPAATVDRLNCRVRLAAEAPVGLAGRIDRIVRRDLPRVLAERFGELDRNDARVLVIRALTVSTRLARGASESDEGIAENWARALADGVGQEARHGEDSGRVRIFADRTHWTAACMLEILAHGTGEPVWWYGPLRPVVRGKSVPQALAALFAAEPLQQLPILAHLHRSDNLDRVLGSLTPDARQELLARVPAPPATAAGGRRDRLRPILTAALLLLRWSLTATEFESLLTQWLARETADVLDWASPQSLADAILMAVRFAVDVEPARAAVLADVHKDAGGLPVGLHWVDRERLQHGLTRLSAQPGPIAPPLMPLIGENFAAALDGAYDAAQLALTVLARVGATDPVIAANAANKEMICATAPLALRLRELPLREQAEAVLAWRHGQGPLTSDTSMPEALRPAVSALLETLLASNSATTGHEVVSACAGVVVLLRALSDVNLARVLATARAHAPSLPETPNLLATALCCAWAGNSAANQEGQIDPGLRLLLGTEAPVNVAKLSARLALCGIPAMTLFADAIEAAISAQLGGGTGQQPSTEGIAFGGPPGLPVDDPIGRAATCLLGHWARWLRGFEQSSAVWLLDRAVRRPGRLIVAGDRLTALLPPLPLDLALAHAGYLEPLRPPPWLTWARIDTCIEKTSS
jgi:hypothetical protein